MTPIKEHDHESFNTRQAKLQKCASSLIEELKSHLFDLERHLVFSHDTNLKLHLSAVAILTAQLIKVGNESETLELSFHDSICEQYGDIELMSDLD